MFGGFTGALLVQNKPARLLVTPADACLSVSPPSLCPSTQRYKRLFICVATAGSGELHVFHCLLYKKKKKYVSDHGTIVIFFFFASPSPLFFFFPPPSLLAEVIAGWLRRWAGRERQKNGCFSHQPARKTALAKDWEGLICPVRIGFYCCYCICVR